MNFPNIEVPRSNKKCSRIVHIHQNVPGVMKELNQILEPYKVEGQFLEVKESIGYCLIDVENNQVDKIVDEMSKMSTLIHVRACIDQ
jgi:D-3-phosphoglycerate dehydrogenase / 2-oxoglutarate reductase